MRKILHVDMDAFYASVEQRDDPTLRGRPVVAGGSPQSRGVVCAASYEARRFGVHSAMPCAQAARLCPQAVFLPPDFARYHAVSDEVHAIFLRYTDRVEPLSLDEAYLDVTENHLGEPLATRVAKAIRADIRAETQLTASAGVAPNKFLAKVASDARKPDGLCVVPPDCVAEFLATLPVRKLPGVGPVTALRLEEIGVLLVPDLLRVDEHTLIATLGRYALALRELARGIDNRPVEPHRERKSVGIEDTFDRDLVDRAAIEARLADLANGLGTRLRDNGERGRTVTLKLRYHDFRRITRSHTLPRHTANASEILAVATRLLDETDAGRVPVRLVGLTLSHLAEKEPRQLVLPYDNEPIV